jgi:hypothetical protein
MEVVMSLKMKRVLPIIVLLITLLSLLAIAMGGQGIIAYSI